MREVTREAILAALAEYDQDPGGFLVRHGFGSARSYMLVHEGREYDSKTVVGVAHGFLPGKQVLGAADFSDGLDTVVALLRDRGFEVRSHHNPAWLEAELVLACDLVANNNWQAVRAHEDRAVELSQVLQSLPLHPFEARGKAFRNVNSVQRKTFDIATQHPAYEGKPTRGGKLDREVLQAFLDRPGEMHAQAMAIRDSVLSGRLSELSTSADIDEEDAATEGRVLLLLHLRRERNPKLRNKKIARMLAEQDCLECEACGFDFERTYGERGAKYGEVHHMTPLHVTGATETRLADLAVLCANCHRMIHRGSRWLTVAELRKLVAERRGQPQGRGRA